MQKKTLGSMSFLVLSQHKQFYLEDLSVLTPFRHLRIWVEEVSTEIKGLSTPTAIFTDFQDVCEPCKTSSRHKKNIRNTQPLHFPCQTMKIVISNNRSKKGKQRGRRVEM